MLSLSANAAVGRHTLTVQVMDERGNTAQAGGDGGGVGGFGIGRCVHALTVIASVNALSLHAFVADGGIGSRTYTLVGG